MAVVLLVSATGSPGVTTTAASLALQWPRDVLLVDADRVPSQAIEAGVLGGVSSQGRGLMSVAQAHRERRDVPAACWEQTLPLSDDERPQRRYLPGFTHPSASELFGPVWGPLGSALASLDASGIDVIIDAGRIGQGIPSALAESADAVVVVTRSSLRALAALRLHLPNLLDAMDLAAPQAHLSLLVIGPGDPYSAPEITQHFGVPVVATLPNDPKAAAVVSDGAPQPRGFTRGSHLKAVRAASLRLAAAVSGRDVSPGMRVAAS